MAQMLPNTLPHGLPGHLAKVWRQLKNVADDDLQCRISYQINKPIHPDFLLTYKNRSAFLVAVSNATSEDLAAYVQRSLSFEEQAEPPGLENENCIDLFTKEVLQGLGAGADVRIQHWVLFPNASNDVVHRLKESWAGGPREFFGKGECRSATLLVNIEKASQDELDESVLKLIVGRFSPEIVVPAGWVSQKNVSERAIEERQTDFLLDIDQEIAVKREYELSGEAFKAAGLGNLQLVTGTAGCGKTLILLLRARLFASMDSSQRILVLMHNKPLRADLVNRAKEIGMAGHIEWRTFYSWISSMLSDYNRITPQEWDNFINQCLERSGYQKQFKPDFLLKEFAWISDNGPEPISLKWYLTSPRSGRKRPLQENQRKIIYGLYVRYRKMLDERGLVDYPVLPRMFLKKLVDGEIECKRYHTIYIDEAQFFAPVWFRCVRKALDQERGRFFLVADPTQGFLRSGLSWAKMLGSDMRGRSQRLQKPYRNTREIMAFAKDFYESREIIEEDEVNIPSEEAIRRMPSGQKPELVKIGRKTAPEIIVEQLKQLTERGQSPGHILFIDASGFSAKTQLDLLQKHFPDKVIAAEAATDRSKMRVTTIGACTGIESPVVVLVGVDRLLEKEEDLGLDAIEREELIKWNTKKVFVAITRAAQKLIVIYRNDSTREKLLAGQPDQSQAPEKPEREEATADKEKPTALTHEKRIQLNRENGYADRHGLPYPKAEKDEIFTKYRAGKAVEKIATEHQRSPYSIALQLTKIELISIEEAKSYK